MEELEQIDVVRLRSEVLLEQVVDGSLEHEGVVDGNVVDALDLVPARLTSAGDGGVHHVVCDEEVRLELVRGVVQAADKGGRNVEEKVSV